MALMGSGCRFCDELWHDLAGKKYPSVEERRSPAALRAHVHDEEWELLVQVHMWSISREAWYLPAFVVEAAIGWNLDDCTDSLLSAAYVLDAWCTLTSLDLQAGLAACDARMVQGMFRYGDAWLTDEYTQDSLRAFTTARLARYLRGNDPEMLLDAINGLRMIWGRQKRGLE